MKGLSNSLNTISVGSIALTGSKDFRYVRTLMITSALFIALLFGSLLSSSLVAAQSLDEAIDTKPSLMWLSSDLNVTGFDNREYGSFLGEGELWSKNWGVSAKLLQNDRSDVFGLPEDSEYFNLDVKRRFGSDDKSNVELGLGWQSLNIDSQLEASGPKVSLSGRLNFKKSLQLYGQTSYFPELEDDLSNNDATAFEFEAGLLYQPIPAVSFKAGYRIFELDLEDTEIKELGSSSGFLLGTDFSF